MRPTKQPLSPVDEWWNRAFPPHSTRRLCFFLAVYPVIGLAVEAGMGLLFGSLPVEVGTGLLHGGFSWIRYALITLSGMGVLCLLWLSGSLRPAAPAPSSRGGAERAPAGDRPNFADFWTGLPFGTASVMVVFWALGDPITPFVLAASLAAGAVVSATVVLRDTIWAPILLSAVLGAGIGVFLLLFGMFMGGPQGILANWGLGSLIAALFVFPAWQSLRASCATRRELPMWVLMSGMLILVSGAAVLFRLTEGS